MAKLGKLSILLLILLIIVVPFVLRDGRKSVMLDDKFDVLVILTPHNEALRQEYTQGFKKWYGKETGKDISIDWRYQGGGQETSRYIESTLSNNFMNYWIGEFNLPWTSEHAAAFSARSAKNMGKGNALQDEIYDKFAHSDVGCGVDLLFGGGMYEFILQADRGNLIPCDIIRERPDLFSNDTIPEFFAGGRLWDREGRWFGSALSSFGIIYNAEALLSEGIEAWPRAWGDLARPEYFRKLAVVDPTKSSSMLKAFSMLIQQQMQIAYENLCTEKNVAKLSPGDEFEAVSEGWLAGLKIIQKIAANGRYFTESATKPLIDVSTGNCLAGISVDFYGLSEVQHLEERSGSNRMKFVVPCGGTEAQPKFSEARNEDGRFKFILPYGGGAPSPDPVAVLRGARRPDLAKKFIEYVVSMDGQKLLAFKAGTDGGPAKTTMCRTPILKTIYEKKYEKFRVNPDLNPYEATASFVSHDEWTEPVYSISGLIIKLAFIDNNIELVEAWGAILRARADGRFHEADAAESIMCDLSELEYGETISGVAAKLRSENIAQALKFQNNLCDSFRRRYILARSIAEGSVALKNP
ncbi:MAG: extracellular solute-binding protein [Puniceicoccales bacterium]|jgi:ABC-type Fe3+ transport system substrate-binding protein|nr:extracellular solute-binding protein [Puniceicoccales bacterium]